MALLQGHVLLWLLMVRNWISSATFVLVLGVMLAWLGIFGIIELAMPPMALPSNGITLEPGRSAHLQALPVPEWSIPVGRLEFDAYNLALDRDDEKALAIMATVAEWLPVRVNQEVLVVLVEGDEVQVELLDGADGGRRGWLRRKHLAP
jgi:hypothetical protein